MIIGTTRAVRVFAFPAPVDLRKGYDGLYGRIFDEWRRSGESLAAFGRRYRYPAARLYWWRRRLADPADLTALALVPV